MATNSYWKYIKKRQAEAGNIQQSSCRPDIFYKICLYKTTFTQSVPTLTRYA